ncbi:MAG: nucleoid-associated protein [Bacteroidota bacterium]
MFDLSQARLTTLTVHRAGNKVRNEGVLAAKEFYPLEDEQTTQVLEDFFLKAFKSDEFFKFSHESDLSMNEVYTYCRRIFERSRKEFIPESANILTHLYQTAIHPHIKSGELYIAHFRECKVDDMELEAIGIFKTEHKDTFLQLNENQEAEQLELSVEQGIHTKKLDKGCLIFNAFPDDGYSVLMVNQNSEDTQYWRDEFLGVTRIQDNSYQTASYLNLAKDFCENVLAEGEDRKEQVLFLNKSMNYFSKADNFDVDDFRADVMEKMEQREAFDHYRETYEEENQLSYEEPFAISKFAVRQMKKHFKTVIKFDNGIQIILPQKHTEEAATYLERAYDEQKDMYYYKVYYRQEEF